MFSLIAAENNTRRADPVANLNCRPYMPNPIEPSIILNAYNVYPFAYADNVRLTLLSPISHLSS